MTWCRDGGGGGSLTGWGRNLGNVLSPSQASFGRLCGSLEWRIPGEGELWESKNGFRLRYFESENPVGFPRDVDYVFENNNIKYTNYTFPLPTLNHLLQWFLDFFFCNYTHNIQ